MSHVTLVMNESCCSWAAWTRRFCWMSHVSLAMNESCCVCCAWVMSHLLSTSNVVRVVNEWRNSCLPPVCLPSPPLLFFSFLSPALQSQSEFLTKKQCVPRKSVLTLADCEWCESCCRCCEGVLSYFTCMNELCCEQVVSYLTLYEWVVSEASECCVSPHVLYEWVVLWRRLNW